MIPPPAPIAVRLRYIYLYIQWDQLVYILVFDGCPSYETLHAEESNSYRYRSCLPDGYCFSQGETEQTEQLCRRPWQLLKRISQG